MVVGIVVDTVHCETDTASSARLIDLLVWRSRANYWLPLLIYQLELLMWVEAED